MNAKRRQRSRIQAAVQVRFRAAGASTTRNLLMARMALLLRECGKPQARQAQFSCWREWPEGQARAVRPQRC